MRKTRYAVILQTLAVLALVLAGPAATTKAAPKVEYTWTLAALGQGGWIGGPLFEDGSVGGGGALSLDNGQLLARFTPTTWTEDSAENITICFDVTVRKGPTDALPPTICVGPTPATGTPVRMLIFG